MSDKAKQLTAALAHCTGTSGYHRLSPLHGDLLCTDGVKTLAETGEAYWLVDAIASHLPEALKDSMLQDIQFWRLTVNEDNSAVLVCERDTDDVAIRQEIPFTDFPLGEIKIYVQPLDGNHYVALLPSEY